MRKQHGFSLLELLTATSIAVVTTAVGLPMLQDGVQHQRLRIVAQNLHTQLRQARSRTVMQGEPTMMHFTTSGDQWRYNVDKGSMVSSADYPGVRMSVEAPNGQLGFEPMRGMALSTGQVTLLSSAGEIRLSVQPAGRIKTCSPSGEHKVSGYADCPISADATQVASAL